MFGIGFLLVWEFAVQAFDLKPYFLPAPSAISEAFFDNFSLIKDAAFVSGKNALVGLIAGTVLGIGAAFLLMRFRILNELATPMAVALNAIPIIVLVSLFINMYPATSEMPRLMVTLIVFFIVLVNVAKGLRQVHPIHVELMRSYAASPVQLLRKARIPNAVPYLFTASRSRPRRRSSRPSSPSTSAATRTVSAAASHRTWRSPRTPWRGRTCSAPAWSV